ncbi:MAG: hypothetical protein Q4D94_04250 [Bacillota bacterium]|nr:hypothetical protein [Bacillota bacterium]
MGFFDKLLNSKEAKKLVGSVVDNVLDYVGENAKDVLNPNSTGRLQKANAKSAVSSDEEDCCYSASVVGKRIKKIIAENFSDCELRENIASREIGADDLSWKYTYGVYRNGTAIAMINLLDNPNDYKRKNVLQSKAACREKEIGYVHFLLHLPNRSSYISEKLTEIIPA